MSVNLTKLPAADQIITHRTRINTASIHGLSNAISDHAAEIRFALTRKDDGEKRLQSALELLLLDVDCLTHTINEQAQ